MQVLPPQRRVRCLPPALLVLHLQKICKQNMVVRARVTCPGGGVAGVGVDEPARGRGLGRLAAPAAHLAGHPVEVRHRGV